MNKVLNNQRVNSVCALSEISGGFVAASPKKEVLSQPELGLPYPHPHPSINIYFPETFVMHFFVSSQEI